MTYALITGSTSGIGAEYAHQLATRGYGIVVVSNRREENLQMATSLSSRYGVEALPLYADLSRAEAAREIYDYVEQQGIEVEILVCNAGMLLFSTLCHTEPQALERIVALHCTTPTLLCRLFAERMVPVSYTHLTRSRLVDRQSRLGTLNALPLAQLWQHLWSGHARSAGHGSKSLAG